MANDAEHSFMSLFDEMSVHTFCLFLNQIASYIFLLSFESLL